MLAYPLSAVFLRLAPYLDRRPWALSDLESQRRRLRRLDPSEALLLLFTWDRARFVPLDAHLPELLPQLRSRLPLFLLQAHPETRPGEPLFRLARLGSSFEESLQIAPHLLAPHRLEDLFSSPETVS